MIMMTRPPSWECISCFSSLFYWFPQHNTPTYYLGISYNGPWSHLSPIPPMSTFPPLGPPPKIGKKKTNTPNPIFANHTYMLHHGQTLSDQTLKDNWILLPTTHPTRNHQLWRPTLQQLCHNFKGLFSKASHLSSFFWEGGEVVTEASMFLMLNYESAVIGTTAKTLLQL